MLKRSFVFVSGLGAHSVAYAAATASTTAAKATTVVTTATTVNTAAVTTFPAKAATATSGATESLFANALFSSGLGIAVLAVVGGVALWVWAKKRFLESQQQAMIAKWNDKRQAMDARIHSALLETRKRVAERAAQPATQESTEPAAAAKETASRLIRRIPFERNPWFTGRTALLERIRSTLSRGTGPLALIQAGPVPGFSGLGKSQLAAEYAYKYANEYKLIWWLRASSSVTLMTDLADLAVELGLHGMRDSERADAALAWLSKNGGWLIISDDAESLEDLRGRLPLVGKGRLIITSRFGNWEGVATVFDMMGFEPAEAVAFLLKRAGQADASSAREIAAQLNNHPLALELVGAYLSGMRVPMRDYLPLYEQRRRNPPPRGTESNVCPESVATAWALCMERVHEQGADAARLLCLIAFLAPEAMPTTLLQSAINALPYPEKSQDPPELAPLLTLLEQYGMIRCGEGSIAIHRLVQSATRLHLNSEARRDWILAALHLMIKSFPVTPSQAESWPVCRRLLPHAVAAANHAMELGVELENVSDLLHRTAVYLYIQGQFRMARDLEQRAFRIAEKHFGLDHPVVAEQLGNLGRILLGLNDLDGARQCQQRAYEINNRQLGPNHASVAANLNDLGLIVKTLGQFSPAAKYFEQALAAGVASLEANDPLIAQCSANLGAVLHDLGNLESARGHFEKALHIMSNQKGESTPDLAMIHRSLGMLLLDMEDWAGARGNLEHALEMFRVLYPDTHPFVQRTVTTLKAMGDKG